MRHYLSLKRHLTIRALTLLFLAEVRSRDGEKNPELTVYQVRMAANAMIQAESVIHSLTTAATLP